MNESRFLLLVGQGNHFHGGGFSPKVTLSYNDEIQVWTMGPFSRGRRFCISCPNVETALDDALILVALFHMSKKVQVAQSPEIEELTKILQSEVGNLRVTYILAEQSRDLVYSLLPHYFAEIPELKVVAVRLGYPATIIGPSGTNSSTNGFVEKLQSFNIKNIEFAESTASVFSGKLTQS